MAENLPALHPQLSDGAGGRRAAVDEQEVVVAPVGVKLGGEDSALAVLDAQDQRTRPVTEEDAGGAVLPVEDSAERFGPDDQGLGPVAGPKHRVGDAERVEEAGA